MTTQADLTRLTKDIEGHKVLSVYLAKESQDPGQGEAWKLRLSAGLDRIRDDLAGTVPPELPAFERAAEWILSSLSDFGRILPHEGWCGLSTPTSLAFSRGLAFRPAELVRWDDVAYLAPLIRSLKSENPVVVALLDRWHAHVYRFQNGELSAPLEMAAERELADASDVGVAKRASAATGARGMTATDFAQRSQAEEARRLRADVLETVRSMSGDEGGVVLGGTREATAGARRELSEDLAGRVVEVPELSFDTAPGDLLRHVRDAASRLTESRQARLLESCEDPRHGSTGWNGTHRALAAGAVDTLLISGDFIASEPDDAERIVRLALAQGAQVEEVSGELGARLRAEQEGMAARLRYVPASLRT